jgi:hypothetical protein
MSAVSQGSIVIVKNVHSNGINTQAAIVTRAWGQDIGQADASVAGELVNLVVLPDAGTPQIYTSVPFLGSYEDAEQDSQFDSGRIVCYLPKETVTVTL